MIVFNYKNTHSWIGISIPQPPKYDIVDTVFDKYKFKLTNQLVDKLIGVSVENKFTRLQTYELVETFVKEDTDGTIKYLSPDECSNVLLFCLFSELHDNYLTSPAKISFLHC